MNHNIASAGAAEPSTRAEAPIAPSRSAAAACLLLFALSSILYAPSIHSDFVRLDDYQYVVDNARVRDPSWSGAWRFLTEVRQPSTVEGYYQPLTMFSLMADAALSGQPDDTLSPMIFHLTNVLLHGVTAVMVFLCLRTIVGGFWGPFAAALLFVVHPAQVETVSWISQRKSLLATPLALGCLMGYFHWARRGSRAALAVSFVLYLLANLAKPTVVLLPLVLPLLDRWPLRRSPIGALRRTWPFFAVMPLFAWVAVVSQASAGEGTGVGLADLTTFDRVSRWAALLCYNLMLYAGNLLYPVHLSPMRAMPSDLSFSNPVILCALVVTAAILAVWMASFRRAPAYFTGFTGAIILLSPAMGPVRFMASCVADRFLYLPMLFLFIPLAVLIERRAGTAGAQSDSDRAATIRRNRLALIAVAVPLLAVLAVLNRAQQRVWYDSRNLWAHVADAVPYYVQAHSNLAMFALEDGDIAAAIEHSDRALKIDPRDATILHLLARAIIRDDRKPPAGEGSRTQSRGPDDAPADTTHIRYPPGAPCAKRAATALPLIREALRLGLGPSDPAGHVALAEVLVCLGDDAGADAAAAEAIRLGFTPALCHAEIGDIALRYAHRFEAAVRHYRKALELDPENIVIRWNLGAALEYAGNDAGALAEYEAVRSAHEKRGLALPAELGRAMDRVRRRTATRPAGS